MKASRQNITTYFAQLQEAIAGLPETQIDQVVDILLENVRCGKKVFICGNGGSASTASHFACDLAKNTAVPGSPRFKVIALTDNMALITALANDTDYDNVFAAQLAPLVEYGDVIIGISCSGNSANVLNAMVVARGNGATTIGFTGDHGGRLKELVDLCIKVPSPQIEQQEDLHLALEHCICAAIRNELADKNRVPAEQSATLLVQAEQVTSW